MNNNFGSLMKSVAKFMLVVSLIAVVYMAYVAGKAGGLLGSLLEYRSTFSFGTFFLYLVVGCLVCAFEFMVLYGIGEGVEAAVASHVLLLEEKNSREKQSSISDAPKKLAPGEWRCPLCGRINRSYMGQCSCGATKP